MLPNIRFEKEVEHNEEPEKEAGKETPIRQIKINKDIWTCWNMFNTGKIYVIPVRQTKQYYTLSIGNKAIFCTSDEEYFFSYCKKYL